MRKNEKEVKKTCKRKKNGALLLLCQNTTSEREPIVLSKCTYRELLERMHILFFRFEILFFLCVNVQTSMLACLLTSSFEWSNYWCAVIIMNISFFRVEQQKKRKRALRDLPHQVIHQSHWLPRILCVREYILQEIIEWSSLFKTRLPVTVVCLAYK